MISVFLVATFNIALGFFVAYILDENSILRRAKTTTENETDEMIGKNSVKVIPVDTNTVQQASVELIKTDDEPKLDTLIPNRWLEILGDLVTRIETVQEAGALVPAKQIENVTKQMAMIDERLKACGNNIGEWSKTISECQQFFNGWCEINRQFIEELRSDCPAIEYTDPYWKGLDGIVQNHITAMEKLLREIDDAGTTADKDKLLESTRHCIPMICEFRDQVNEKIAINYQGENAVEIRDRSIRIDAASGVFSRAAITSIFDQWWESDPQRDRVASVALVDICDTSSINQRFGFEVANEVIANFIEGLQGCTRQNRGYDRVARFTGQQVFIFLGDTSLSNTIRTVSRFMGTMQQTEFHVGEDVFHLSQNAVVTRLFKEDTVENTLQRLVDGMPLAKDNGPNALSVFDNSLRLATDEERMPAGSQPVTIG